MDNPLPTGLSWVQQAATIFHSFLNSLVVNVSWSLLADKDNLGSQSSPQEEDSNATLVSTIPSTPDISCTPTIVPPNGLSFPKSPCISFYIIWWRNAIIFTAGLASSPITSNVCSILGATPRQCPPTSNNSVEPLLVPTLTPSFTSMDDHSHPLQIISPSITILPGPSNLGPDVPAWCYTY